MIALSLKICYLFKLLLLLLSILANANIEIVTCFEKQSYVFSNGENRHITRSSNYFLINYSIKAYYSNELFLFACTI